MITAGAGGKIINITSIQDRIPHAGSAAYAAAKAGLKQLTKVMALELGPYGILVNAIAPGEIVTAMTGMEGVDPLTVERPNIPLRRPGSPREIADFIIWLASDRCSYTTGATFTVDGGASLI